MERERQIKFIADNVLKICEIVRLEVRKGLANYELATKSLVSEIDSLKDEYKDIVLKALEINSVSEILTTYNPDKELYLKIFEILRNNINTFQMDLTHNMNIINTSINNDEAKILEVLTLYNLCPEIFSVCRAIYGGFDDFVYYAVYNIADDNYYDGNGKYRFSRQELNELTESSIRFATTEVYRMITGVYAGDLSEKNIKYASDKINEIQENVYKAVLKEIEKHEAN